MDPGDEIAGWIIERQLGLGGMGEVFLARHPRLPRLDAVKVLDPDLARDETFRRRFFRESDLVCGLIHPHVVSVYDRGEDEGRLYFAMQYVSGGDLRQRLNEGGPLPLEVALKISAQLASALDAAHDTGLVHRDIKPENVLLMPGSPDEPFAVLADFGISRSDAGDAAGTRSVVTKAGQILATPAYASPEAVLGDPVDGRADQYALGCMLFELLSGKVPYPRDSMLAAFYAHVNDPVPRLPGSHELAEALAPVFERVLAKDPVHRYPTCGEFVRAAIAAADTSATGAGQTATPNSQTSGSTPLVGSSAPANLTVSVGPPTAEPPADVPRKSAGGQRRRNGLIALIALVVVAALVAVTAVIDISGGTGNGTSASLPAAVGYTPRYASRACPSVVLAGVPNASCGTLTIPQDRSKPNNGREVRLLVTRAPARGKVTSDPVIDFGTDTLSSSPVRDHAEEIQLSQRGFAPSEPVLTCPEYAKIAPAEFTRPIGDPQTIKAGLVALKACYTRLTNSGIDLNQYNYDANADDMLDLLRALHLTRVNVVGGDTATVSILRLDRAAPDAVQTITLQDPVLPGESADTNPTQYFMQAFDDYAALCANDTGCRRFGDLQQLFHSLYVSYQAAPVQAKGDAGLAQQHTVYLDGGRVSQGIAAEMEDPRAIPLLASAIAQPRSPLLDGLLADGVVAYQPGLSQPDYAWGAVMSNECSYDVDTVSYAHSLSAVTRPELSGVDEDSLFDCDVWKVKRLPDEAFDAELAVNSPTLIVQGTLAPFASTDWGQVLSQQTFTQAAVATFPTLSSSIVTLNQMPCLATIRQRFIADHRVPVVAACVAASPKIPFVSGPR